MPVTDEPAIIDVAETLSGSNSVAVRQKPPHPGHAAGYGPLARYSNTRTPGYGGLIEPKSADLTAAGP